MAHPRGNTYTVTPSRILIVEDDEVTARFISHMVDDMGEVQIARNGREAISMAKDKHFDIVLLDAVMPGMSGFEVCKTLKEDPDFFDLPIIFVTSHTDIESETRALENGAVDFISKPPNPTVVRARVKSHLALKHRTDQLNRLASVDSLTGLANRRAFDIALEQEWRRACRSGTPLSLLMIDIDHFKRFNDLHGHLAGDDCLRAVSAKLAVQAKRPGELVTRYGGEEFAVILPACDMDAALHLAEMIREGVSKIRIPFVTAAKAPIVTISIGVASRFPGGAGACSKERDHLAGAWELVKAADSALFEAKRAGRNRVVPAQPA